MARAKDTDTAADAAAAEQERYDKARDAARAAAGPRAGSPGLKPVTTGDSASSSPT